MQNRLQRVLVTTVALAWIHAGASEQDPIHRVLFMGKAPTGVVLEIGTADGDALTRLVPRLSAYAQRLRKRFPKNVN